MTQTENFVRLDARVDTVLRLFKSKPFTSAEFIDKFKATYPSFWLVITDIHPEGGKGVGIKYTSSMFIGAQLEKRSYNKSILKLERIRSPKGWGNPWITVWANVNLVAQTEFPDEAVPVHGYPEGKKKTVEVNIYERSSSARKKCVAYYGTNCAVCEMNFPKIYGARGNGFIHVHHIKPLSAIGKRYKVNPITDLRPVCPNCHAMIHAGDKVLSISAARALVRKMRRKNSN